MTKTIISKPPGVCIQTAEFTDSPDAGKGGFQFVVIISTKSITRCRRGRFHNLGSADTKLNTGCLNCQTLPGFSSYMKSINKTVERGECFAPRRHRTPERFYTHAGETVIFKSARHLKSIRSTLDPTLNPNVGACTAREGTCETTRAN